ncbi:MAG: YeaH/YhbH family protein [Ferrimonas sp.]
MAHFIDRRLNSKGKSTINRQRFLRRYKQQIKKAVSDSVTKRSVTDVDSGEQISIPSRNITEPVFHHGAGGKRERIHPGNDQFSTGDRIERPPGSGQGAPGQGQASNSGDGQDSFVFDISKDEYLDVLFDDLALPNLQRNNLDKLVEFRTFRAGVTTDGVPANIHIVRSLRQSLARRTAMSGHKRRKVKELSLLLDELENTPGSSTDEIKSIATEIELLKSKISSVPFIDTFDLRYNAFVKRPIPTSKAVMFCLMDVSGSMDQSTKDMAKRFYILLYLFLTRTYKSLDVVFIRHHTQAKEVDEHEFFYSQETGGTIVSSALKLMHEIQKTRYPENEWNIYAAQASDGDNWADDSPQCHHLMKNNILPVCRYYTYIEITNRAHQTLWREYESLAQNIPHFALQHIRSIEDIYPVFRELFRRQAA